MFTLFTASPALFRINFRVMSFNRFVAIAVVFVTLFVAQMSVAELNQTSLTTLLETVRDEQKMPGLRAAVIQPDGTLLRSAVGLADIENELPLDHDIGMPGGSTGKTLTATLVMLLVEEGVFSLTDPASKWVGEEPWFNELPNREHMQIRHLLSHSSGMGDYPGTRRYLMLSIWRALRHGGIQFSREELITMPGPKPLFPVGQGFAYTDSGYLVLGKIIEAAAGEDYYTLVADRILTPLNLNTIQPQDTSVLPNITPGYTRGARNLREDDTMKVDPISEWTGGGWVLNPTALATFYRALANGEIITQESFELMKNSGWHNPETPSWHYGFGMFVVQHGRIIEHGGLWPGFRTYVRIYPEDQTTIAIQTNRDGPINMEGIADQIFTLRD